MFKLRTAFVLVVTFAAAAAYATDYVPGELIIKYKTGYTRTRSTMNMLYDAAGVTRVRRFGGTMKGYEQIVLGDDVKLQDAIAAFGKSDAVEYVQPNYIIRILPVKAVDDGEQSAPVEKVPCYFPGIPYPPGCDDSVTPAPTPAPTSAPAADSRPALLPAPADVIPAVADPALSKAYGLGKISAPQAWNSWKGSKDFVVAVIDTGIDYNHEDLAFNVWRKTDPSTGQVIVGHDFIHNDDLPFDDQGHGTHTSGTVGAVGGNGKGVSGVNQRVSIMGVKFLDSQGSGTTADAVRGIDFAVQNGAKVLSNSWGGPGDDSNKALQDSIERAKAADILFVAAAGNDGKDNDTADASYPAAFNSDNIIAVAATDRNDNVPYWSNYGVKSVHVGAPGNNVYSTLPGNKYGNESGTSMACPHVAGAAALVWSKHPQWNYKKVKEVLMNTVDPVPALNGKTVTGGRINVLKALRYTD